MARRPHTEYGVTGENLFVAILVLTGTKKVFQAMLFVFIEAPRVCHFLPIPPNGTRNVPFPAYLQPPPKKGSWIPRLSWSPPKRETGKGEGETSPRGETSPFVHTRRHNNMLRCPKRSPEECLEIYQSRLEF